MRVCLWFMHTCVCMHAEARGGCQVSYAVTLCLILETQFLTEAGAGPTSRGLQELTARPGLLNVSTRDLNSGPHACIVSTLNHSAIS